MSSLVNKNTVFFGNFFTKKIKLVCLLSNVSFIKVSKIIKVIFTDATMQKIQSDKNQITNTDSAELFSKSHSTFRI